MAAKVAYQKDEDPGCFRAAPKVREALALIAMAKCLQIEPKRPLDRGCDYLRIALPFKGSDKAQPVSLIFRFKYSSNHVLTRSHLAKKCIDQSRITLSESSREGPKIFPASCRDRRIGEVKCQYRPAIEASHFQKKRPRGLNLASFEHGQPIAARHSTGSVEADFLSGFLYVQSRRLASPTQDHWVNLGHSTPLFGQADTRFDLSMQSLPTYRYA
ncbi:hypothetical protein [Rhizobium sp. CB3171]|uniref:hypothetical protein n=1 Tax=Rhizobium sp. CB3171 TaxID=3039157 RepID=UPI0032C213B5